MKDLILFSIDKNHFALELDKIKRIVQATTTTPVAGNAEGIEGIFTFEDYVLNVLNFRTMIGLDAYDEIYAKMFARIKRDKQLWIDALQDVLVKDQPFTKQMNAKETDLGKWLATFSTYDPIITDLIEKLSVAYTAFFNHSMNVLNRAKSSKEEAQKMLETLVIPLRAQIDGYIETLNKNRRLIANSLQKFLIIDAVKSFAVRIDDIDDIIAISEKDIQASESFDGDDSLVRIDGIFEYKDKLVNLIDSIKLPTQKGL